MNTIFRTLAGTSAAAVLSIAALVTTGCGDKPTTVVDTDDPRNRLASRDLDPQDFKTTSANLTRKMLTAPRLQKELQADPQGNLPLMKLSTIRNDTSLKINLVDWMITPMETEFVNSGKADMVSEDKLGQEIAAGQAVLGTGGPARLPGYTIHGLVSKLATADAGQRQNAYKFVIRVTRTSDNVLVFTGEEEIGKRF